MVPMSPVKAQMLAEFDRRAGHYGNALQAASAGGLEQVVKLLLDYGADVNCPGGW